MSSSRGILLRICVHPEKKKFGFLRRDDWSGEWHIHLVSKPHHNEANEELERETARLFQCDTRIVKGEKSHHKVLEIFLSEEEVQRKIRQALAPTTKQNKSP
ncbi:MAG: DUF167 domain-containing protein [Candidatus Iainarchaeum archaeon]|uniref:DUF167 domain-containing protein n=1 Tax=Candidatus Iainarchaeum sp. TaxID=3101447 RepID=A0A7T9DJX3_9ARCH|nr:MAG: DUF167 domain-containing protein [Candidatus Diapherotrites archaeon]